MKTLACADMGLTCPFVAKGDNDDDLVAQLTKHGNETHPEEVKMMRAKNSEAEMDAAMRSKIKESAM